MSKDSITILDDRMRKNEIKIIKSHAEILGFNVDNDTGFHLFIQPEFDSTGKLTRIKILA